MSDGQRIVPIYVSTSQASLDGGVHLAAEFLLLLSVSDVQDLVFSFQPKRPLNPKRENKALSTSTVFASEHRKREDSLFFWGGGGGGFS